MPQHQITLFTIADKPIAIDSIMKWWNYGETVEMNQRVNPWLLYYSQWFDPWLSSYNYFNMLEDLGFECSRIGYDITVLKANDINLNICNDAKCRDWQYTEQRWLYFNLYEAIDSYDDVCDSRLVYLFNRCTASVLDDEKLREMLGCS